MDIQKFIADLNDRGIFLWKADENLRYRAGKEGIKDEDLKQIKERKAEIMEYLGSINDELTHDEAARYDEFPMTDVQSAYKLGRSSDFEYSGVGCHVYMEVEYDELDAAKAERIWNKLIRRHDMLRCVFLENGKQQIKETVKEFKIPFENIGSDEEKLAKIREELGHKVYDLSDFPLYDICISKTADKFIMHISMELIIADWVSISLLLDEFDRLYKDENCELPEIEVTFRDYQMLEMKNLNSPKYKEDEKYWLDRLADFPAAPELPLDVKEDAAARFSRYQVSLSREEWKKIKELASKKSLTPTSAVLAVFSSVIGTWSSNEEYCINLTLLNRKMYKGVQQLVGDFTSVSMLSVKRDNNFFESAKAIQKQMADDLEHRMYSGVEVLREISRRKGSASSLMPIVFTSAIGFNDMENGHLTNIGKYGISQTPQVFIDCQVMDSPAGLTVNWDVRDGVFPDGLVKDMFTAFSDMLAKLADINENDELIADSFIPAYQMKEREEANSVTGIHPDKQLHEYFLEQAAARENEIAVIDEYEETTYLQLLQRVKSVAKKLSSEGVGRGDHVAVVMGKTSYQLAAVLGTLAVGAVYVPIDKEQPLLRQKAILDQIAPKAIMTCSKDKIELKSEYDTIEADQLEPYIGKLDLYHGDPDDSAYIIFTSGSTGTPKGVEVSHRAAANTIFNLNKRFNVNADDKVLALARLNFDLSVYDIFGILGSGGTIVFTKEEGNLNPGHWADLIKKHHITVWNTVPAMMQMLNFYSNGDTNADVSSLRLVMLSGDWIPVKMPETIRKFSPSAEILCMGGATEAAIWSNLYLYKERTADMRSIPYGKPLENQKYYVLNSQLRDCPVWTKGQLFIAGAGLAKGYYNNPEETANHFIIHPEKNIPMYATGDMGRYLPGGDIEFLGREDSQIKIKGHRIEMGEIEATLCKHPDISSAVVLVHEFGGEKNLFAFVELEEAEEQTHFEIMMSEKSLTADETELKEFVSMNLPSYMVPFKIHIMEKLPLNDNGKVDRSKLKELCETITKESIIGKTENTDEEDDPLTNKIIELWAETLGVPEFTADTDYYSLGADSLSIAQVASKLRDIINASDDYNKVPYNDLFSAMLHDSNTRSLVKFINTYDESEHVEKAQKKNIGQIVRYGGGKKGPLRVVFHAGVGTMSGLRSFLDKLEEQELGPIIGIIVSDFDTYYKTDPYKLIEILADDYTELICGCGAKEIQLIGYCMGGIIAVEVARRLKLRGENLIDLVLVESQPMTYMVKDELVMEALFQKLLDINMQMLGFGDVPDDEIIACMGDVITENNGAIPKGAMAALHGEGVREAVGDIFRKMQEYTADERLMMYIRAAEKVAGKRISAEMVKSLFFNFKQSIQACYIESVPYMGDIRFLEAKEKIAYIPWANNGAKIWEDVCMGKYSVDEIEGDHYSCIKRKEYLDRLVYLVSKPLIERNEENA